MHRLIEDVVSTKQSVTNIRFGYLKYCLVSLEQPSYLSTLLPCKRMFCEKEVVIWMKVMPCLSIKMITNSISWLHCLDGSDISYIACIFCMVAKVSLFNEVFSAQLWTCLLFLNPWDKMAN